jgi:hypothetical protein
MSYHYDLIKKEETYRNCLGVLEHHIFFDCSTNSITAFNAMVRKAADDYSSYYYCSRITCGDLDIYEKPQPWEDQSGKGRHLARYKVCWLKN